MSISQEVMFSPPCFFFFPTFVFRFSFFFLILCAQLWSRSAATSFCWSVLSCYVFSNVLRLYWLVIFVFTIFGLLTCLSVCHRFLPLFNTTETDGNLKDDYNRIETLLLPSGTLVIKFDKVCGRLFLGPNFLFVFVLLLSSLLICFWLRFLLSAFIFFSLEASSEQSFFAENYLFHFIFYCPFPDYFTFFFLSVFLSFPF